MTKKGRFFKLIKDYFQENIKGGLGWIWVSGMPAIGSLILVGNYFWLEKINPETLLDYGILTFLIGIILGLALLPTTLTAICCGFFLGWVGFLPLVIGYLIATVIGYQIGRKLNPSFLDSFYEKYPKLERELSERMNHPGKLIFFVRISPIIPFAISNFIFASLKVRLRSILTVGLLGMLPRTWIAFATGKIATSFLGAKESINSPLHLAIGFSLVILSGYGIYRQFRKSRLSE